MPRNVAIVLFENAEEFDFVGPWEVFTMLAQVVAGLVPRVHRLGAWRNRAVREGHAGGRGLQLRRLPEG